MRFLRLRTYLTSTLEVGVDLVAYEEVRKHLGVDAAHIYGGVVSVIQSVCEERARPYVGIPVGTVKRLATGKGNASKEAMIAAATSRWPGSAWASSDEVDARWIAEAALQEFVAP